MLWSVMKAFVSEGVKVKFSMTNSHTHEDLEKMVHPSQLEVKYGGAAENLTTYWPP